MGRRPRARISVVDVTPFAVVIRDIGPWDRHPTVTNDAEGIVERVAPMLDGRRLFYFDSEGELTELKVRNGKFAGFAAVRGYGAPFVTAEQIARGASE